MHSVIGACIYKVRYHSKKCQSRRGVCSSSVKRSATQLEPIEVHRFAWMVLPWLNGLHEFFSFCGKLAAAPFSFLGLCCNFVKYGGVRGALWSRIGLRSLITWKSALRGESPWKGPTNWRWSPIKKVAKHKYCSFLSSAYKLRFDSRYDVWKRSLIL
jgi:hypothetical protein